MEFCLKEISKLDDFTIMAVFIYVCGCSNIPVLLVIGHKTDLVLTGPINTRQLVQSSTDIVAMWSNK